MVKCTWWQNTGKHVPADKSGISRAVFADLKTGQEVSSQDLPIGALWVVGEREFGSFSVGKDGLAVCCRLPGNKTWYIDGRASNCTMPDDKDHRCWVRHGTVGEELHVDKNGLTCAAGAGSIAVEGYHGFLHHGELTEC